MGVHQVRALLMGGQACVFYGAAEFSRDAALLILADAENLRRLSVALAELSAECISVPAFQPDFLDRGHAIHFRCHHPEANSMRIDVMSVLRGVAPFPELWERRTTLADTDGTVYELLALPDLVQAKKTQRDKDWPMIRRLLEADYAAVGGKADEDRLTFWLRELRTPELLIETAQRNPTLCEQLKTTRPLLVPAAAKKSDELAKALEKEEKQERERDRIHWQPLKTELEKLRREKLKKQKG